MLSCSFSFPRLFFIIFFSFTFCFLSSALFLIFFFLQNVSNTSFLFLFLPVSCSSYSALFFFLFPFFYLFTFVATFFSFMSSTSFFLYDDISLEKKTKYSLIICFATFLSLVFSFLNLISLFSLLPIFLHSPLNPVSGILSAFEV